MDIPNPKTLQCAWPFGCDKMASGYDHDHDTDIVRAALCTQHNRTLAEVGDQADMIRELADWVDGADLGFTYSVWFTQQRKAWQARFKQLRPTYHRDYNRRRRSEGTM